MIPPASSNPEARPSFLVGAPFPPRLGIRPPYARTLSSLTRPFGGEKGEILQTGGLALRALAVARRSKEGGNGAAECSERVWCGG